MLSKIKITSSEIENVIIALDSQKTNKQFLINENENIYQLSLRVYVDKLNYLKDELKKLNDQIDNLITRESINTLKNVDGVVFLIDVHQSISDQDLQIISLCLTSGKPIVIGLNKSENLSKTDKLILKKEIF